MRKGEAIHTKYNPQVATVREEPHLREWSFMLPPGIWSLARQAGTGSTINKSPRGKRRGRVKDMRRESANDSGPIQIRVVVDVGEYREFTSSSLVA